MTKSLNKIPEFQEELKKMTAKAIYLLSAQVLSDSNKFVRYFRGDLERSSQRSDLKNGEVGWFTDYAKRVYFTGTPNTQQNPNASLMWVEKAASENKDDWLEIVKKAYADGNG